LGNGNPGSDALNMKHARMTAVLGSIFAAIVMFAAAALWAPPTMGAQACWNLYENADYRFAISYPPVFVPVEPGDALVAPGAVVTFTPIFDPAIDATGAKTNLHEISVTVAVADLSGEETSARPAPADDHSGWFHYCEGAAGNRYETLGCRTVSSGMCYEIVLFIHSANPGCYPAGTVVPFDRAKYLELFARMVSTFSTL